MSITFPISLPTSFSFRTMEITPLKTAAVIEAPLTNNQTVYEHQGEKWQISITWPPLTIAQGKDLMGALTSLNGSVGSFLAGDPIGATPTGVASGTPVVNGSSQSGKVLSTRGWNANVTGILKRGDWISISNRLYQVTKDTNSNGSGIASVDIWPSIRQPAPADGVSITTQGAKGEFRLAQAPVYSFSSEKIYNIQITAYEVI